MQVATLKTVPWMYLIILSVLAGIIYNSWIVGYWLNPFVARNDLASELEAFHQPYNWLFISGDVVSSLLMIFVAVWLWRWVLKTSRSKMIVAALCNSVLFAVGTIFDALVPLKCDPTAQVCPALIHSPITVVHGLFSILASVCLFVAIVLLWWLQKRSRVMVALMVGYAFFGIFSIISLVTPGQDSWAQHYSLILDGICISIIPYATSWVSVNRKNPLNLVPAVKTLARP
jgi:hypothetical protein